MEKPRKITDLEIDFAIDMLTEWMSLIRAPEPEVNQDEEFDQDQDGQEDEFDDLAIEGEYQKLLLPQIIQDLTALNASDWEHADYSSIASCVSGHHVGKPIKIRGSITSLPNLAPCEHNLQLVDVLNIVICDDKGDVTKSCPIVGSDLHDKLKQLFCSHHSLDFFGTILPELQGKKSQGKILYKFFVVDVMPSENPLQMVRAVKHEIDTAKALVKAQSGEHGSILSYIKRKLVDTIGIKGLNGAPDLECALEFMILQALSDGCDPKRSLSHKLHSLVIGSPAVGKKLLTQAAHILNPVCTEGHPGKITKPGIAGVTVNVDGRWRSQPGLIPMAHRGTFVVQDFHHVQHKEPLMAILSMSMEDGQIIDSTAARQKHRALTSIHLDMNRQSHLNPNSSPNNAPQGGLEDLGITMNVLTRFDFIVEIPRDTERQMNIALEMHSGTIKTATDSMAKKIDAEARQLQVLIAHLRAEFAEVEIPEEICEKIIRPKQEKLLKANENALDKLNLLGDYQTRLSNSVHKLIFAIARGNARIRANEADVDYAFRFIGSKMKFLATIEAFEIPTSWSQNNRLSKVAQRQIFIRSRFGGSDATVADILAAVVKDHDLRVSESTIRRDLASIGKQVRHNQFSIYRPNEEMEE